VDADRLAAAKLWLISEPPAGTPRPIRGSPSAEATDGRPRDLPYLAHALYALVAVEGPEVVTMTVDERWRVSVNPGWLDAASVPDVGRALAHLVWHLLADHAGRARDQDVARDTMDHWDLACDMTVHGTLLPDGLVPPGLPAPGGHGLAPGRSAEEYYATLSRLPARRGDGDQGDPGAPLGPLDGCGSGADGIPRSHELGDGDRPGGDAPPGVPPEGARQVRRLVAVDYVRHARRRGDRPGDVWRWAEEILEPRVAWEPVLARAVRCAVGYAAGRGEYTYTRPSRHRSPGIVLPGQRRPVPRVAVVVDTSGSVDDGLLARALGEVDGVLRAVGLGDHDVTVYCVDAAVQVVQSLRRARDLRPAGGGGTDLRVGLTAAVTARPRPDVVVVLTDGCTPWPATPPPGSAVVVALLVRAGDVPPPTPSWATVVECRSD
jgi:predicted metal-dependent peptidase